MISVITCHILDFKIVIILPIWNSWVKNSKFEIKKFTPSGCKDTGIRKLRLWRVISDFACLLCFLFNFDLKKNGLWIKLFLIAKYFQWLFLYNSTYSFTISLNNKFKRSNYEYGFSNFRWISNLFNLTAAKDEMRL